MPVIVDTTAPELTVPGAVVTAATSPTDALVRYEVSATDNSGLAPVVSCAPDSGSSFAIGTTAVDCRATDAAGNVAVESFPVTVLDVFAPTLSVPADLAVNATSPDGATVQYVVSASDNVDPQPTVNCAPESGITFAVGSTIVACAARDAAGNTSPAASFQVTVAGATEQMSNVMDLITTYQLPSGTANSLQVKLAAAQSAPNPKAACNNMNAFINNTQAQNGKQMTSTQAAQLLSAAAQIVEAMDCK